jgi:pilus assembly protein CpaC
MKKIFFIGFCFIVLSPLSLFAREPLIQIAIEVAEVSNNKARNLGIQWLDSIHVEEAASPVGKLKVISNLGDLTRGQIFTDLKLLVNKGAAELLANPKLVSKSGGSAVFKAGGQIPYISSGGMGQVGVEFKEYGILLEIQPRFVDSGDIETILNAEVSAPDGSVGVTLSGNTVPGILQRKVSTQVVVKPGSTITIAGLLQTKKEKVVQGIPFLSEIPIIGVLFGSHSWVNNKTTVVIFLTPTIVEG